MSFANNKPYVRLANADELDKISELACRSFIQDPIFNYFGSLKNALTPGNDSSGRRKLQKFLRFVPKSCWLIGGRITVAVIPTGNGEEKIAAVTMWCPPNRRLALWKVGTLVRAGVIRVLKGWGLNGLMRLGFEYLDLCHKKFESEYKSKGVKESPDASWYLQMACTDPDYQGQGLMSLLIREAYVHAPSAVFTLEATTTKSRDQYKHLGFELLDEITLGKGKVSESGFPALGKEATGVTCYCMANWNAPK